MKDGGGILKLAFDAFISIVALYLVISLVAGLVAPYVPWLLLAAVLYFVGNAYVRHRQKW